MSRNQFIKMSVLTLTVVVLLMASLMATDLIGRVIAAPQSVIVQLKSDPVIVAKAAAEAQGQNFDAVAYCQQLVAEQDQFLNQLSAAGVSDSLVSADAPNGPNGEVSNIQFLLRLARTGMALHPERRVVERAAGPVRTRAAPYKALPYASWLTR